MTLTELRYILAVYQERHFGKAAKACFVSQPTLSVAVQKLESSLKVILFERTKSEIKPTLAGEAIIHQAQRILNEVQLLKQVAANYRDPLTVPLRIGAIYTVGPYLFPHVIGELKKLAPQLPLLIEENYTSVLHQKITEGQLDAIIVALPFEDPSLHMEPLYDEPFVVILPADHPLTQYKKLIAMQLQTERLLVLGKNNCFRDQVLAISPRTPLATDASELLPATLIESTSLETIRHMVAANVGISILPKSASGSGLYDTTIIAVREFEEPIPTRRIVLASRKQFPHVAAIQLLQKAILSSGVL